MVNEKVTKIVLVLCFVVLFTGSNGMEISCSDKGFICFTDTKFYQCVHNNGKYIILGRPQECPYGLFCNDGSTQECEERLIEKEEENNNL
ncbi:unnamed protein product [Psylliodes chrysocephalus]|uniref:Chitin-binding type-2 domain-containing protein n=1 Tax=Psylliodes chrysocephalus TaxID=3402493 RepID=A0A9P0GLI8_9CUCU|nr:unnamed protein product [Psylliodes chrysocephala]